MAKKQFLFVSYSRADIDRVEPIVRSVERGLKNRQIPVDVWMDVSNLSPGQQWNREIERALDSSVGFLFFVTQNSLQSAWFRKEVAAAAVSQDRLIIPILLDEPSSLGSELPLELGTRHYVSVWGDISPESIVVAAGKIVEATSRFLKRGPGLRHPIPLADVPRAAGEIAQEARAGSSPVKPTQAQPNAVFVVHGHDAPALASVEAYLRSVGVTPIVLSRTSEADQSLFQRFMRVAGQAAFAIVVLTADDVGASRRQYESDGVADRALQFRARQNVILEMGFFYGKLGWENVFVVFQEAERVFPNFERPSDLDGVVFDSTRRDSWQTNLGRKLAEAGFRLTPSSA